MPTQPNYFILTGAMGGGKSTILRECRKQGVMTVDEPARHILAEQRGIAGEGVPDKDARLFTELLLSRSMFHFKQMQTYQGVVVFDRGVADNISYATLFELDPQVYRNAAQHYQYNTFVFHCPAWEDIYTTDEERKMTYQQAQQFGDDVIAVYRDLNYQIIDVPLVAPAERAQFILKTISQI